MKSRKLRMLTTCGAEFIIFHCQLTKKFYDDKLKLGSVFECKNRGKIMKPKHCSFFLCILCICLLSVHLSGCLNNGNGIHIGETVENPFTVPPTEQTETHTETTMPDEDHSYTEELVMHSAGFKIVGETDDAGSFVTYDGENCCIQYAMNVVGNVTQYGIGVLLFVDGRPQPYKSEEDDSYSYMHTFYPPEGEWYTAELNFTPITGEQGDTLEFWIFNVRYPDYSKFGNVDANYMSLFGRSDVGIGGRIYMNAAAEPIELPEVTDRVISSSVRYVDLTAKEVEGWTDQEMLESIFFHMYVNDSSNHKISNFSAEDGKLRLRMEVYGSPYLEYGVVFFVDHQPVLIQPEDLALFDMQNGKKAIVEVDVDMSGFDSESYIYAMMIPRNRFSIPIAVPFSCMATECVQVLGQ